MFELDNDDVDVVTKSPILIVDDHPPSLFLLETALQASGLCNIIRCQDSRQVESILNSQQVSAILLDLRMPHVSGEQLLELLIQKFHDIPVLIVTSNDDVNTAVHCMKSGAFDYVVKPVDKHRLVASVKTALTVHNLRATNQIIKQLAKQQIQNLEYFDGTTNLPNRKLLKDRLEKLVANAKRFRRSLAVLCLDIDHFQRINQTLGHAAGDQLLAELASRLMTCVRETDSSGQWSSAESDTPQWNGSDTVGRVGSDEFAIVLSEVGGPIEVASVAERIKQKLAEPLILEGMAVRIDVSIGISYYPDDGDDAKTLLKNADAAMHFAKHGDSGNCQFYHADLNAQIQERLLLENELRACLDTDRFLLYYQPKFDAASQELAGAEALVRWRHPNGTLMPPDRFIPIAEETGLIVPLGDRLLEQACMQIRAWQHTGLAPLRVAVNLSAVQFRQPDLVERVRHILHSTGVAPHYLELELTESLLMSDEHLSTSQLRELKALGVWLALDDFGTGYSSLSYLKRFPLDILKIDRSFVSDIGKSSEDDAIVQAIISLGHSLQLQITGEGVETAVQQQFLSANGCDELQGYLLGKPLPAERFAEQFLQLRAATAGGAAA